LDKDIHIKRHLTLAQVIDCPAQCLRQDTQGFAFGMFLLLARQQLLLCWLVPQA
jgi:hypothetical protein